MTSETPAVGETVVGIRSTLRHDLYRQLDPAARTGYLSLLNRLLVLSICLAAFVAVIETEPMIVAGRETMFRHIELAFGTLFGLEYLARLWVCVEQPEHHGVRQSRWRYAVSPAAIIDLIAILPALVALAGGGALVLRFFRVLRILRLAKLGRMSRAWLNLIEAVHSRRHELWLIFALAGVAILVSSTLLYWAESHAQPEKFGSIPRAFWWAMVTLTTVGYGDIYPITPLGKFFASMVAVAGIGLIALPTGILAAAFSDAMQRDRRIEAQHRQDDPVNEPPESDGA
ncbi:ion transporter [Sphingomonas sp.]|uniref:ion transporter n=1 Tax=Sphingomonas sp. TaxID=28214 RepID=UPI003750355D